MKLNKTFCVGVLVVSCALSFSLERAFAEEDAVAKIVNILRGMVKPELREGICKIALRFSLEPAPPLTFVETGKVEVSTAMYQRVPFKQVIFTAQNQHQLIGWRDPAGRVWLEYQAQALWSDAQTYCKSLGLDLPTVREYESLANLMGASSDSHGVYQHIGFRRQVFEDFLHPQYHNYWTSEKYTGDLKDDTRYNVFSADQGMIINVYEKQPVSFRCIARSLF